MPPTNISLSTSLATADTVVKATCPEGYHFYPGMTEQLLGCGDGPQWNDTLLPCWGVHCLDPPVIPGSTIGWNNQTHYGSSVLYTCFEDLRLEDGQTSMLITCQWNSQWNFTLSSCQGSFERISRQNTVTVLSHLIKET